MAVGCLAERYGEQLAEQLPEADAVLGFDAYAGLPDALAAVLRGDVLPSHAPGDRRKLLPISPVERAKVMEPGDASVGIPGHAGGPTVVRRRLEDSPVAPLKLASGCDRRCAFCAIPSFRGSFVSRRPSDVLAEARWLAEHGVRELVLVSENSTSYGKDLGDLRLLETLLPELAALDGIERVRLTYLQPAEMRPGLVEVLTSTPGVAPYFDMSFQHSSPTVLRRMRRFGSTESFLALLDTDPRRRPDGRRAQQRHRRLPRRDRGRRRRARALPGRRAPGRRRRLRLLRRGRHRGRAPARPPAPGRRRRPRRAARRRWSRS